MDSPCQSAAAPLSRLASSPSTSAWCSPTGLGNHDLGYARSPDGGITWLNNDGVKIGETGTSDLISIDDPHVVVPIAINRGLINQETQAFDGEGRLHVRPEEGPPGERNDALGRIIDEEAGAGRANGVQNTNVRKRAFRIPMTQQ